MVDAVKALISYERRQVATGFVLLLGVLGFAFAMAYWHLAPQGPIVDGRVVAIGTQADDHGEQPVLTVQLSDGTSHIVLATRAEVARCRLGSRIALVPRRTGYRVGMQGCNFT
jgi:hypothetical protein